MNTYLILLRGINVGGKNKIFMTELKKCLEEMGFENVTSYINSGNVFVDSKLTAKNVTAKIEEILPGKFKLDSEIIKILAISKEQLETVVKNAPQDFGSEPQKYYSDVIFLLDKTVEELMDQTEINPEVDTAWPGKEVVYYQRLGAKRTKSRLGKVISKPIYKSLTIRSWNTVTKLLNILDARSND
jgi:uncharacterized protein (DUF1697 family)